jgi:hypothetical protein
VEHPETINAMGHLAITYGNLGKYAEAEKLQVQVLDAKNRILGVEHPEMTNAMGHLAATYWNLGKFNRCREAGDPSSGIKKQNS